MKTKISALLIACFITISVFAQTNLNNYKYVIVPNRYDFLKEKDQYRLNSLTQFLFNKYGFQALMEGEKYPDDLVKNRCLALKSDLVKDSGMFKTKLAIELKDCNDQIVYTSEMGESREKEYDKAYNEAVRNAFESIEALNYKYVPSAAITSVASQEVVPNNEVAKEIQQLKEEIESLKKEKETVVQIAEPQVVVVEKVPEKPVPAKVPTQEVAVKEAITVTATQKVDASGVLYAQAIDNGFQLVDSTPKVVYRIKKTGMADVFLVESKNATLYKKGDAWILEYYENDVLKQDVLNIKF
ncbi:hypothetical protein [Mariniflexile sp.]|uniref:hypothetical protein n=1 Tax=Mariniflexile sp. TaxID=1979402 RepID=UPI0040483608